MRSTSLFLALFAAILLFALPVNAQPQQKDDATTILNRMFGAYTRFASYQDEGILVHTIDEPTGGTIEKMPFKTFFKTPNLFRFEWTDYGIAKVGKTKIIWFNGKDAFSYWEPDIYEKEKTPGLAIAGATGISYGAVHTVLDLLIPEERGGSILKRLTSVSLLGEELFEGTPCYRIKATLDDDLVELWIGKSDFLLRKFRQEAKFRDGLRITEEIRRKIQVDQSIPEAIFNYKPPIPLTPRKEIDSEAIDKLLNPEPPVWTEFKSDEGRFSVLMPEKPQSQVSTLETGQGRFEHHVFIALHHPLVCMVAYVDIPKKFFVDKNIDGFFDELRDQFIKEADGKLASETPLSMDGHAGREVKVHIYRGDLRLRMFLVGDRAYVLSVVNMEKADEEVVKKFFGSFKINRLGRPIAAGKALCETPYCSNNRVSALSSFPGRGTSCRTLSRPH